MHDDRRRSTAWLPLAATLLLPATALAEVGVNVAGSVAQETWELPLSTITVDWQRLTVSPWWRNDDWRLSADLPFITRDAERRGLAGGLLAAESDAGLGDASLRARRQWLPGDALTTYVAAWLKLPTGDENAGTLVTPGAILRPTRQGQYSLGTGTTDLGITPGVTLANTLAWGTAEAGYILSEGGAVPQEDRPVAYLGAGLTPVKFLEFSVEFDYEGEAAAGGADLQQVTGTITLTPFESLSLSLSTYTDNSNSTPDENWTLGISGGW